MRPLIGLLAKANVRDRHKVEIDIGKGLYFKPLICLFGENVY